MLKPSAAILAGALFTLGAAVSSNNVLAVNGPRPAMPRLTRTGETGPFWAWCWSPAAAADKNLVPMVWVTRQTTPQQTAAATRKLPAGKVAIFLWGGGLPLLKSPADMCRTPAGKITHFPSPWLRPEAAKIGQRMANFFRRYKAAGGRLNFLVMDYEAGINLDWYYVTRNGTVLDHLRAINADPRSAALKKQLGFSDLFSVLHSGKARRLWNALMGQYVAEALHQAYFQPAKLEFPALRGGNYGDYIMPGNSQARVAVPNADGHYRPSWAVAGNVQSPSVYGEIGSLKLRKIGGHAYGCSPFAILRWKMMRQAIRRSRGLPLVPWVSYKSYYSAYDHQATFGANHYYEELIYQLALRGADQFLYWNPGPWDKQKGATPYDNQVLNHCLAVLNKRFGAKPGKVMPTGRIGWRSDILVAARKTSTGKILYRVTVSPGVKAIDVSPGNHHLNLRGKTGIWVTSKPGERLAFRSAAGP